MFIVILIYIVVLLRHYLLFIILFVRFLGQRHLKPTNLSLSLTMLVNIISFKLPKSSIIVQSDLMTYRLIVASLFRFIRLTDRDIKALLFRFIRLTDWDNVA